MGKAEHQQKDLIQKVVMFRTVKQLEDVLGSQHRTHVYSAK